MEVSKGLRYSSVGGGIHVTRDGRYFALISEVEKARYYIFCCAVMPNPVEVDEDEVEPFIEWLASL